MKHECILEILARFSVDLDFRRRYQSDPYMALTTLGFGAEELSRFTPLSPELVHLWGRVYDYHRHVRIIEHLPWANPLERPAFASHFERHALRNVPALTNRDEAIAFCRLLENEQSENDMPWVADLARFERLRIAIAWQVEPAPPMPVPFDYPVLTLLQALERPGIPQVAREACRIRFKKVPTLPAVVVEPLTML